MLKAAREICIAAKLQGVSVSTGDRTRRMAATLVCQKSSSDITPCIYLLLPNIEPDRVIGSTFACYNKLAMYAFLVLLCYNDTSTRDTTTHSPKHIHHFCQHLIS